VLMRGHFTEVVLDEDGTELHAFVSGRPPAPGDEVGVCLDRVLVYRDGALVGTVSA
jgi:hypothetical protein